MPAAAHFDALIASVGLHDALTGRDELGSRGSGPRVPGKVERLEGRGTEPDVAGLQLRGLRLVLLGFDVAPYAGGEPDAQTPEHL